MLMLILEERRDDDHDHKAEQSTSTQDENGPTILASWQLQGIGFDASRSPGLDGMKSHDSVVPVGSSEEQGLDLTDGDEKYLWNVLIDV